MSWASSAAARLKESQVGVADSQRIAIEARRVVGENADAMWGDLIAALECCTQGLAEELPLAKEKCLRAVRLGSNNLTIQTSVYPLLKFEILFIRDRKIVTGRITENMSALSSPRCIEVGGIGMTVDRNLHPYFTDGERLLAAVPLAEELMEKVLDFFERASAAPSFLA